MKIVIHKLVQRISSFYPGLKRQIRIAHLKTTPRDFIYQSLKFSLPFSLGLTIFFFLIIGKAGLPRILIPIAFIISFFLAFNFTFLKLKAKILKDGTLVDIIIFDRSSGRIRSIH